MRTASRCLATCPLALRCLAPVLLALLAGCRAQTGVAIEVRGLKAVPTARALSVTFSVNGAPERTEEFPRGELTLQDDDDTAILGLRAQEEVAPGAAVRVRIRALPPRAGDALLLAQAEATGTVGGRLTNLRVQLEARQLCSRSGWCWQWPQPAGRLLTAIWGSGPRDIWAGGPFGTLLRYDGEYWAIQSVPALGEADLRALWGTGPRDLWAVATRNFFLGHETQLQGGLLLHFDGAEWHTVKDEPSWIDVPGLWGAGGEVWVAGRQSTPAGPDGFVLRCTAMGCDEPELLSTIRQASLQPMELGSITGLWTRGPGEPLYAAAASQNVPIPAGYVLRRERGAWRVAHKLDLQVLSRVWGSDQWIFAGSMLSDVGVTANGGTVYRCAQEPCSESASWIYVGQNREPGDAFPLAQFGKGPIWGVGSLKTLSPQVQRLERGGGARWEGQEEAIPSLSRATDGFTPARREAPPAVHALFAASDTDVWAAGSDGMLRRYDGTSWEAPGSLPLQPSPVLRGFYARSESEAWAVGAQGTLLRLSGDAWVQDPSPTAADLHGVFGTQAGEVFAVGAQGTVLRRQGGAWVDQKPLDPVLGANDKGLLALWGTGPRDLWAVGEGVILRWDGDGAGWSSAYKGPETFTAVWGSGGDPQQRRWAVGCTGYGVAPVTAALRLVNGRWEQVAQPADNKACYSGVWFNERSKIWLTGGPKGVSRFNDQTALFEATAGSLDVTHCFGRGDADLWCAVGNGLMQRGDGNNWFLFNVGTWGRIYNPGRLFSLGKDLWYYGAGIVRCREGGDCARSR